MSENTQCYTSQERHAKGKLCKKLGSVDGNYSTGRARPLISHTSIPSKATTFEDYHISISFFGSVRKVSKWAYQKSIVFQHLSQNTTLIQDFRPKKIRRLLVLDIFSYHV